MTRVPAEQVRAQLVGLLDEIEAEDGPDRLTGAIRAVLALHRPPGPSRHCPACHRPAADRPCPTVAAVFDALDTGMWRP